MDEFFENANKTTIAFILVIILIASGVLYVFVHSGKIDKKNITSNQTNTGIVVNTGNVILDQNSPELIPGQNLLKSKGFDISEDEYTQNQIFETLTPYASIVNVKRFRLSKDNKNIGYIYLVKMVDKKEKSVSNFLIKLLDGVNKDPKVIYNYSNEFGKVGFYYNNLDKSELIRIVVDVSEGIGYGFDYPKEYNDDMKKLIEQIK